MNFTKLILLLSLVATPIFSQAQETKLTDEQKLELAWKEYLKRPEGMSDKAYSAYKQIRIRNVCSYGCPEIFSKEKWENK